MSKEGERKDGRGEEGEASREKHMQVMPDWNLISVLTSDHVSSSTSPPGRQLWQCISCLGQTLSGGIHNGDLVQMVPRFSWFLESGVEHL